MVAQSADAAVLPVDLLLVEAGQVRCPTRRPGDAEDGPAEGARRRRAGRRGRGDGLRTADESAARQGQRGAEQDGDRTSRPHASYRNTVTRSRRDPAELAALIEQRVTRGLDLVDSFLAVTGRGPKVSSKALALEHRKAVAANQRDVSRYRLRVNRLKSEVTGGAVVAGVGGSIGLIDAVGGAPSSLWLWFGAAGVGPARLGAGAASSCVPSGPSPVSSPSSGRRRPSRAGRSARPRSPASRRSACRS